MRPPLFGGGYDATEEFPALVGIASMRPPLFGGGYLIKADWLNLHEMLQ